MKVLIIRLSSIGDIVLTSPIIRCVKNQLSNAEIHFLTKENYLSLIAHNPHIYKVHRLKDNDLKGLINDLKKEKYDIVIDLHKNLRTYRIKKALNAQWYTFNKLNFKKWLFVNFKIDLLPNLHIIDRYFEGLKSLQISNDNQGIEYHMPDQIRVDLDSYNLKKNQYYVISLGATYFTKQIPNGVLLSLFKRLKNTPIVLIGAGTADIKKAETIINNTEHKKIINLCNKLSIDESAYVIKHAKTIITGDTGMMHIASSFDLNIVTLWGNTHPKFGMYAYASYDRIQNHLVDIPCHPCSKLGSGDCPRGHFNCMKSHNIQNIVKNLPK